MSGPGNRIFFPMATSTGFRAVGPGRLQPCFCSTSRGINAHGIEGAKWKKESNPSSVKAPLSHPIKAKSLQKSAATPAQTKRVRSKCRTRDARMNFRERLRRKQKICRHQRMSQLRSRQEPMHLAQKDHHERSNYRCHSWTGIAGSGSLG